MLKLLVAFFLVMGSVQCAAACTPVKNALPACHHHKQAPACSHELVPATIVQSSITDPPQLLEAAVIPELISSIVLSSLSTTIEEPSPPGVTIPPPTILRI